MANAPGPDAQHPGPDQPYWGSNVPPSPGYQPPSPGYGAPPDGYGPPGDGYGPPGAGQWNSAGYGPPGSRQWASPGYPQGAGQWTGQPYPGPVQSNGLAVAALVLGITSVVFCWWGLLTLVQVVLAITFGSIGISRANRGMGRKGIAVAGLTLGIFGFVLYFILGLVSFGIGWII